MVAIGRKTLLESSHTSQYSPRLFQARTYILLQGATELSAIEENVESPPPLHPYIIAVWSIFTTSTFTDDVLAKQLSEGVYEYRLRKCPRNGDGCVQEGLVG